MNPPLDVLVCSPAFAPELGGAQTWMREVTTALVARGHRVAVIARASNGIPAVMMLDSITVMRIEGNRVAYARAIARRIATQRPNVVLAQYSALPFASRAGHREGIPVVGVVHDVYGGAESRRVKGVLRGTIRSVGLERSLRWVRPTAFLVPSHTTAAGLRPLIGTTPVSVVRPGTEHLRFAPGAVREPMQVLFVGRLVPQKGVADLIDAIRMLRDTGLPARAVIAGAGPEKDALLAAASDLGEAIRFDGRVDNGVLARLFATSAVLAFPSTREGWGLAITEAAAHGIPYVAYDLPAVREQHELIDGGLLVSPRVEALAGGIGALLRDPARATALGAHGRDTVRRWTWKAATDTVEAVLREAVEAAIVRPSTSP